MYFVTPCAHHHEPWFGFVRDGEMHPNPAGRMVTEVWQEMPLSFPRVTLDAWVLMPNHFHGLLLFDPEHIESNPTLGDVMKWFKAITTNRFIHGVRDHDWPRFDGHLWQRNFHDHIVRNDADLDRIRAYIGNNPATWEAKLHVASVATEGIWHGAISGQDPSLRSGQARLTPTNNN
jgi:REP element-mobilizing transposase RayT